MMHHRNGSTFLVQHLLNTLHFVLPLLIVRSHVPNQRNARILRRRSPTLAILDRDTLTRLHANDLTSMQIDCRIRLARRRRQTRRRTKHMILWEIVIHLRLLNARHNPTQRTRAHDRHAVFAFLLEPLQHGHHPLARLRLRAQLGNHGAQLALHVVLELLRGQLEVVLLRQAEQHAAEVLADIFRQQLRAGVAVWFPLLFEDLVGQLGARFEGEGLGEHERVVAVEEDVLDLGGKREGSVLVGGFLKREEVGIGLLVQNAVFTMTLWGNFAGSVPYRRHVGLLGCGRGRLEGLLISVSSEIDCRKS